MTGFPHLSLSQTPDCVIHNRVMIYLPKRAWLLILLVMGTLFCVIFFALASRPMLPLSVLYSPLEHPDDFALFWNFRLPRAVMALLIGAALSVSGLAFQTLLKNPLADPYILGVSGGASLGYVMGVALGVAANLLPVLGFAAAFVSLIFIYQLAQERGVLSSTNLLLIGVIFNSFTFALILVINAIATFGQAHQILHLMLGSLDVASWREISVLALFVLTSSGLLLLRAPELNLIALGDEEALHLGVDVAREKKILFFATSLLVGASVALCGLIGFVGLFVPHLMRLIFGADHRMVIPAAFFFGGLFLLVSDYLARHILMGGDYATHLPVGVITALIGAPVFVVLLKRQMKGI